LQRGETLAEGSRAKEFDRLFHKYQAAVFCLGRLVRFW
jgi:hypothetical protein